MREAALKEDGMKISFKINLLNSFGDNLGSFGVFVPTCDQRGNFEV